MRNLFPGYYQPTQREFERIWREGVFVFDTNVLLDIFRYSDETAEQLLSTLESLKDRVWLPYQAATEYHRSLEKVIYDQQRPYDQAIEKLAALQKSFPPTRRHPFLEPHLSADAEELFRRLLVSLTDSKKRIAALLTRNPTKERIAVIFTARVGERPTPELTAIYQEAKARYEAKIPPGYGDADKPEPDRYGDFLLWKEILNMAKEDSRPVVLVTGDAVKDDWFVRLGGQTIGPRPELVAEFSTVSTAPFYLYQMPQFLKYANEFLRAGVATAAINEVAEQARRRSKGGLPKPSRDELLNALEHFDQTHRDTALWAGWESRGRQKYAIAHRDRRYPVKQVISIASGVPRGEFSGGTVANEYLRSLGFTVIQVSSGRRDWEMFGRGDSE